MMCINAMPPIPKTAALRWIHWTNVDNQFSLWKCRVGSGACPEQSGPRRVAGDLVDLPRKAEVFLSRAALTMSRKGYTHHAVINCDVGVVSGFFSGLGNLVHERDGRHK